MISRPRGRWLSPPAFLLLAVCVLAPAGPAPAAAAAITLEDCLRETALRNPQIVQQARDLERAAGMRLTLRSRALPTLSVSGILGQQSAQTSADLLLPGGVDARGKRLPNVTATRRRPSQFLVIGGGALFQPIFDAAIPASWRRGNLESATALENYYTVAVTQLNLARTLFANTIYYRDNGVLLAEIDRSYEANIKSVENLVNAGLGARQALLQARVQRASFAVAITSSTGSYESAFTALLGVMGRDQAAAAGDLLHRTRLEGTLDDAPFPFDPRAAAREALARRPDLEALRVLARSYVEDAGITRAGYLPLARIYVTGEGVPQSSARSDRPNALRAGDATRTSEIRPGIRYDWNVVDTGTVRGTAQLIDRTREGVEISLRKLEEDVPRDLAKLRASLDAAAATMRSLRGNLLAAEETLNLINAAVSQGTSTQLEFDNAQTGLLATRSSLLLARLQTTLARAEFDRITGGYLRFVTVGEADGQPSETRAVK